MRGKIYFQNYEENVQTEQILRYLNNKQDSRICFEETNNVKDAEYALLLIGENFNYQWSMVETCKDLLKEQAQLIVLVKKSLFEAYERYKRASKDNFDKLEYQIIQIFNENKEKRRWIYAYVCPNEINNIIGKVILAEYFNVTFLEPCIEVNQGEDFQNILVFQNKGYVKLEEYYIDGFFSHKTGKHRPKLQEFSPIIKTVNPDEKASIAMKFQAPDIAGSFIFYIIIKKADRLLKMEDSIRSFILHVKSKHQAKGFDAVLLKEYPENGKLYTNKIDFEKTWRLKNVSGVDWEKVIFKVKYEHLTHYFCKERKKIYSNILNGDEFEVKAKFHPPDIPGKYTVFWQLMKEDGTEIITDGPLCCSVVTQYETQSLFEVCDF